MMRKTKMMFAEMIVATLRVVMMVMMIILKRVSARTSKGDEAAPLG